MRTANEPNKTLEALRLGGAAPGVVLALGALPLPLTPLGDPLGAAVELAAAEVTSVGDVAF